MRLSRLKCAFFIHHFAHFYFLQLIILRVNLIRTNEMWSKANISEVMTNERSVSEVSAAASGGTPVKYNQNFIINIYNQYFKLTILSFRQCLSAFTSLKLRSFGITSQFFANASKLFVRNWFDCIKLVLFLYSSFYKFFYFFF